jgi:hypothetical protein
MAYVKRGHLCDDYNRYYTLVGKDQMDCLEVSTKEIEYLKRLEAAGKFQDLQE